MRDILGVHSRLESVDDAFLDHGQDNSLLRGGGLRGYELVCLADRCAISLHLRVEQADGNGFRRVRDRKLLRLADDDLATVWVQCKAWSNGDRALPTGNHSEAGHDSG